MKDVLYCGICSLPFEYCEYHPSAIKCQSWLQSNHPDLYLHYYSDNNNNTTTNPTTSTTGTAGSTAGGADARSSSRGGKAQLKDDSKRLEREQQARLSAKILLRKDTRNKRKSLTIITGLAALGLDLKKVAKRLANKFACGCSVQVNQTMAGFPEEVVLQGDYVDQLVLFLPQEYAEILPDNIEIA